MSSLPGAARMCIQYYTGSATAPMLASSGFGPRVHRPPVWLTWEHGAMYCVAPTRPRGQWAVSPGYLYLGVD